VRLEQDALNNPINNGPPTGLPSGVIILKKQLLNDQE